MKPCFVQSNNPLTRSRSTPRQIQRISAFERSTGPPTVCLQFNTRRVGPTGGALKKRGEESRHPTPTATPDSNPICSHSCRNIPHTTQLSAPPTCLTVCPLGWLALTRKRPQWIIHTLSALERMKMLETYQRAPVILSFSPQEGRMIRGPKTLKTIGSRVSEQW